MPAERYYCEQLFSMGQQLTLDEKEHHHLAHVMRSRIDDQVELVNGKGQLATASVTTLGKRESTVLVQEIATEEKPLQQMILVQAIPRPNRLDYIIEKSVELGITQLWLLPAKHSERKQFNNQQMARIEGQMIAAMKQCGRLFLPTVKLTEPLSKFEVLPFPAFFGDTDEQAQPFCKVWEKSAGVIFFTGPESGFDQDEVLELRRLGAQGVKLHPNILRTDTASIAALSLISHWINYQE